MAKKTIVRRMFKYLPMAVELRKLTRREEDYERSTVSAAQVLPAQRTDQALTSFLKAGAVASEIANEDEDHDAERPGISQDSPQVDADTRAEPEFDDDAAMRLETLASDLLEASTIRGCERLNAEALERAASAQEEKRVCDMCDSRALEIRSRRGQRSNGKRPDQTVDEQNPAA